VPAGTDLIPGTFLSGWLETRISADPFTSYSALAVYRGPWFPTNPSCHEGREIVSIRVPRGWVAQLVEHATENRSVAGSIPAPATTVSSLRLPSSVFALRKPCWSDFSLRLFRGRFVFREAKGMENGIDRSLVAAATGGRWRRWGKGTAGWCLRLREESGGDAGRGPQPGGRGYGRRVAAMGEGDRSLVAAATDYGSGGG